MSRSIPPECPDTEGSSWWALSMSFGAVHGYGVPYARQPKVGTGLGISRVDDVHPLLLGLVDLALAKPNLRLSDFHVRRIRLGHTLFDDFRRMIDVFLLKVNPDFAGKSVGRLRMVLKELLILGNGAIEITFAVKDSRLSCDWPARSAARSAGGIGPDHCCGRRGRSGSRRLNWMGWLFTRCRNWWRWRA